MKRKILSLLLASSMLAACMSGCGKSSSETKEQESTKTSASVATSSSQSESSSQEEKVELEEKTIQVWIMGPGKQKDSDKVWEAFNEKLQEYVPNTTVEFTIIPDSEYNTKFTQLLAAEEPVDIAWVGYASGKLDTRIADGDLMPLDSLAEEYGQGIIETLGADVLDLHRSSDGKLYYFLCWQGLLGEKKAIYVPTELAELAGDGWLEETKEAVNKWWNSPYSNENYQKVFDQLDVYFKAAKDADKLYSGYGWSNTMGWNLGTHAGIMRYDNTFTVVPIYEQDSQKTLYKNLADFYKKGYIRSDVASLKSSDVSFVKKGEYNPNTVITKTANFLTDSTVDTESLNAGVKLSAIPIEEKGTLTKGSATGMAIPYCADEPERAMMVLNELYTNAELYQLLVYGIEGTHYTLNGDGTITTPYGSSPKADSDYGLYKWTVGTCKNAFATQNDVVGYYEELEAKEAEALVNPFMNFVFDSSSVSDVIAALSAVDSEYTMLNNGSAGDKWEEIYNEYMAARRAAGLDTLIKEYQRQIDEYIKANNITSW